MKNFALFMIGILLPSLCFSQISKQESDSLILNVILLNDISNVEIYTLENEVSENSTITLYDNSSFNTEFGKSWIYFVDDLPYANWNHPSRFILINSTTGEYKIISLNKYPYKWKEDYLALSVFPSINPPILPSFPNIATSSPSPHKYAVIVSGPHDERFWNDVSAVYSTLKKNYGFKDENIYVH